MKFRLPRKLKKKLKKYKWIKDGKEVKPWSSQEMLDEYKSGNLDFTFWNSQSGLFCIVKNIYRFFI